MWKPKLPAACRGLQRSILSIHIAVLLILTITAQPVTLPACSSLTLKDADLMYGFPVCDSPGVKDPYLAELFYDPGAKGFPKDVLFTLRTLYGTVNITIADPTSNALEYSASSGDGPQIYRYNNIATAGKWSITIRGIDGYAKWQVGAFSQVSGVAHAAEEKQAFKDWVAACCVRPDENIPCMMMYNWTLGEGQGEGACQNEQSICDNQGRLLRLVLSSAASGPSFETCAVPPPALGGFGALRVLQLTNLYLNWTLDALSIQISGLSSLQELLLDVNSPMHGGFIMAACELFRKGKALRSFSAFATDIGGNLPPCVFNSTQLLELNLFGTAVSGQLPEFPATSPLMYLNMSAHDWDETGRLLRGSVPVTIGNAKDLAIIALRNNQLNGSLPDLPVGLEVLVLQNNQLSGSIPASVGELKQLRRLHLESNRLSGSVPPGLGALSLLENVWLTDNRLLSGVINFSWNTPNLQSLSISNTNIKGEIPGSLGQLPKLHNLTITDSPGITSQQAFAGALLPTNNIVWYNVSGNGIKDLPDMQHLAAFTDKRFPDLVDQDGMLSAVFDVSNNGLDLPVFPSWILQVLPSESELAQLVNNGSAVYYNFATGQGADSNRIACPTGQANLVAGQAVASSLTGSIFCQSSSSSSVSLQSALAMLATTPFPPPLSTLTSPPDSISMGMPPSGGASNAPIQGVGNMAVKTSSQGGDGQSSDIGLILGCAFAAFIFAGGLFYLLFRYGLQPRRNAFVQFKDEQGTGAANIEKYTYTPNETVIDTNKHPPNRTVNPAAGSTGSRELDVVNWKVNGGDVGIVDGGITNRGADAASAGGDASGDGVGNGNTSVLEANVSAGDVSVELTAGAAWSVGNEGASAGAGREADLSTGQARRDVESGVGT